MTERWLNARAWIVFAAITFGLLNAGVGRDAERALEQQSSFRAGDTVSVIRLLYTDSGDPRRYFAYASAILGRRSSGYFVRSEAAWRSEFEAGRELDPDLVPDLVPAQPLMPYRDFAVEYPPLFFVVVVPLAAVIDDPDEFRVAFGVEMAVVLGFALHLSSRAAGRLGSTVPRSRIVGGTAVAALLLGVVVTHRFDACVGLSLAGMAVAVAEDRPTWAGAAVGTAVGFKLVPVLVAPIVGMRWLAARRWDALARCVAVCLVTVAITLAPLLIVGDNSLQSLVRYHASRPLQVESTWAAVLRLLALADGSELTVVHNFGSVNVVGTHTPFVLAIVPFALIASLGAVLALAWRAISRARDDQRAMIVVRGTIAVLSAYMVVGKVFSPQYVVWLLPLGVVVALEDGRRSMVAFGAILVLTQIIYPIGNPGLESGRAWASLLVVVRNLLLVTWAIAPLLVGWRGSRDRGA